MRKVTANRIFENIEEQEKLIDEVLTDWINNKALWLSLDY